MQLRSEVALAGTHSTAATAVLRDLGGARRQAEPPEICSAEPDEGGG
jgi:hypothetical protein